MYIPAVPATAQNLAYLDKQKEHFLRGAPPPDFPQNQGEIGFQYLGNDQDIVHPVGRRAMGLPVPASAWIVVAQSRLSLHCVYFETCLETEIVCCIV